MNSVIFKVLYENKDFFNLPKEVDLGSDVFHELLGIMDKYEVLFESLNSSDYSIQYFQRYRDNVRLIINNLIDCIEYYLNGDITKANDCMCLILNGDEEIKPFLFKDSIENLLTNYELKNLYKARIGESIPFKREEMFHIPFNNRGIITNQRYSINGIPCLYLGLSTYDCWHELNRPIINNFWVSRYEVVNNDLKILDLSNTIEDALHRYSACKYNVKLKNGVMNKHEWISRYLVTWLIQCACSMKVKEQKRTFREEYVIPQLLMQNIRKVNLDGVKYFSVQSSIPRLSYNIAFPTDDFSFKQFIREDNLDIKKNFSKKLLDSFKISEPINAGSIALPVVHPTQITAYRKDGHRCLNTIKINKGVLSPYYNTVFYDIEDTLEKLTASFL